jgi:hypothetical protein
VLGTGNAQPPEQQTDLSAESTTRDEDETLAAFGELIGQLHDDAAPERLTDERRALVAERGQQVAQEVGVGADRVLAAGLGRGAVSEEIRRDHRESSGQRRHDVPPGGGAPGHAVDEDDDGPGAGGAEPHRVAVNREMAQDHRSPSSAARCQVMVLIAALS